MSPLMSKELILHFENMIYLPFVLIILNKDRGLIDTMPFKMKRPYLQLVDQAIKFAENDLRATRIYMKKQQFKIIEGKKDDLFTEYVFYYNGYEDHRKYMHFHLRNRTEELIGMYLSMSMPLENPHP
ncbi:hypothetical protein BB776_01580 [Planococcus salinarum]|uniref:Uncharacterized protein n=1 Tax=Planococcus salinarum TaxID=622695 RepID=A0ABX3D1S2_9BACL|nr:hypothetical protein [Planococcus salinarum]OHX53895.1 hypothetical protein BB776_01580 [Planococcus salinarum]TAA73406.1 hypothetical protein D2909_00730 [Planococcus salinarum]